MLQIAHYTCTFGPLSIGHNGDNIVSVQLYASQTAAQGNCALSDLAFAQLSEFFEAKRTAFDFPYVLDGTAFQLQVWRALCEIPYAQTRSYKEIAQSLGNPRAARAVGMAAHRNPMLFVVPCHRLIGTNGALVGFAAGIQVKEALLQIESRQSAGHIF